ncbi:MAG: DUF1330 domain-containing protein [Pseudomonadales bacterium]|nr:DUF1330 domain-containing protein [Pseudomonadales bacterium]
MSEKLAAYLVCSSFMPEGHGSIVPYGEAAHPMLEKYEGELLVAGESDQFMELLEGDWKDNAKFTLFRFPSMEHLKAFWDSEDYQSIKHLRTDNTPPNFTFAVNAVDWSKWEPE